MRTLAICLLFVSTGLAQDGSVGRAFMLRAGAKVMNGAEEVRDGHFPAPFVVYGSRGDSFDIGVGLVKRSDAVYLPAAADYYFDYLFDHPDSSWGHCQLGHVSISRREWDNAIKDFTEAIRLDNKNFAAFSGRGVAWRGKHDLDAALRDHEEAIRLCPTCAISFEYRAALWKDKGDLAAAIRDYDEAIRLSPNFASAYNNRAWFLATSPTAEHRDGKKAIADASKACELSFWQFPTYLDTLAAAYAEAGEFAQAVKYQEQAVSLVATTAKPDYEKRLKQYREGKPFRQ